jgi:hypothetical protein
MLDFRACAGPRGYMPACLHGCIVFFAARHGCVLGWLCPFSRMWACAHIYVHDLVWKTWIPVVALCRFDASSFVFLFDWNVRAHQNVVYVLVYSLAGGDALKFVLHATWCLARPESSVDGKGTRDGRHPGGNKLGWMASMHARF